MGCATPGERAVDHASRGLAYMEREQYDFAIEEYTQAIEEAPGTGELYSFRALAYLYKGQYGSAISDCNRAIELSPSYAPSYYIKAVACENSQQYGAALEAYRNFVQHAVAKDDQEWVQEAWKKIGELRSRQ